MNKKIVFGLIAGLISTGPIMAQEVDNNPTGPYMGLTLTSIDFFYDQDDIDFNPSASLGLLGLQAGYRFNENIRVDLEASAHLSDSDSGAIDVGRITLNGYYDFRETDKTIVPYVGGGLGVASIEGGKVDELTWHAEVGTTININSTFAIVPSYRYVGVEPQSGVTDDVLTIQSFRLGARVSF